MEDFRSDILGYLGSRPDYQDLYKRALVDRDYRHTDSEMQRMLQEALDHLAQDLGHFNLENYRQLEGRYSLEELGAWLRTAMLRLGGGAILVGDFGTFVCPESLQQKYRLLPRYEKICGTSGFSVDTQQSTEPFLLWIPLLCKERLGEVESWHPWEATMVAPIAC